MFCYRKYYRTFLTTSKALYIYNVDIPINITLKKKKEGNVNERFDHRNK